MLRKNKPRGKLVLDHGVVRTTSDLGRINTLIEIGPTQENAIELQMLFARGVAPTWSFVKTISKKEIIEYDDDGIALSDSPKHVGGIGLFKCRQTGEVLEKSYKVF